jgi:hypothetical protein
VALASCGSSNEGASGNGSSGSGGQDTATDGGVNGGGGSSGSAGSTGSGSGGTPDGSGGGSASGGASSGTGGSGPTGGTTGGPRYPGAGQTAGFPLQPGFGPDTADDCPPGGGVGPTTTDVVRPPATLCFYGEDEEIPAATIEQVIESVDGVEYVHLRVTFDPRFADNTFGENAVGWGGVGHTWDKVVKSDHVELLVTDCSGETVMQFKVDYVSDDPDSPSGFGTLGVTGGDGEMIAGDPSAVLAAATSIDRNVNGCGYDGYMEDSPATDENYTPNPDAPNWDWRVVYEVWLDASAFDECFGQAYIEFVHSSPAKADSDTITVESGPCPPDWDVPYCLESLQGEGIDCGAPPPDGGSNPPGCPQNYTAYANCPDQCVPVPFAGYTNRAACPNGFVLDVASEGRYCVPESGEVCQ